MGTKVVIDKGIAGLGNRLRTVAATIEYAESTGRYVYVDWRDGMFAAPGNNAFDSYFLIVDYPCLNGNSFCPTGSFYPAVYSSLDMEKGIYVYFDKKQVENRYIRKTLEYLLKGINGINNRVSFIHAEGVMTGISSAYQKFVLKPEFQKEYDCYDEIVFGEYLSRKLDADNVIFVDNIPSYKPDLLLKHIKLQPWIENEIDSFIDSNDLRNRSVGVHVRATGKKMYGDVGRFIEKLKKFIATHEIDRILLCTDSEEIETLFKSEFSTSIVMQPKYLPKPDRQDFGIHQFARDSKDPELQDRLTKEAVIDMFALSKTEYLFYHFGSTFSEISRVYHKDSSKCFNWLTM